MNHQKWDAIWINASILTLEKGMEPISQAALAMKNKKVAWVGRMQDLKATPKELAHEVHDVHGCLITPGLIDCHTHVVFAGNRANEFEMRLQGMRYEEIAKRGGGIQATVSATRKASEDQLFDESLPRVKALLSTGVTTIEVKSGYGLNWETESKILRVAKRIEEALPITIYRTFLGAHAIPHEFSHDPDRYIDLVCEEMIPRVAEEKLAEAVDVFCEKIAFNLKQTERVFQTAKTYQLGIKCHAEQLSYLGSAELAAKYDALSVDHLEYASEKSIAALAQSKAVAVLLPGAFYYLRETQLPPIPMLRKHHVPIAVASDCNPGSSPMLSLLLVMNLACQLYRLTVEEVFQGVTKYAALALGMSDRGTLTVGKAADFVVWHVSYPVELIYYVGHSPMANMIKNGSEIYSLIKLEPVC